jgi:Domain of unknown function (DUF4381)
MAKHFSNIRNWVRRAVVIAALFGITRVAVAQAPPEEDIRGPRGLIEIPQAAKSQLNLWLGVAAVVLGLVIIGYCWWKFRRRSAGESPLALALAELSLLAASQSDLPAEAFANRAAQTIRQFLAAQFGIAAPQRTSEEFLTNLSNSQHSPIAGETESLRRFMLSCDLAKFAGTQLNIGQRDEILQTARSFMERTTVNTKEPGA